MLNDPAGPRSAFLNSARALARGGSLDDKLQSLADEAQLLVGAAATRVYLLGDETGTFIRTGGAAAAAAETDGLVVHATSPDDPLERAARERRVVITTGGEDDPARLGLPASASSIAYAPLVVEHSDGAEEVEGVLAAAFETEDVGEGAMELLLAVADLAAAAVHQTRLEQALAERSDWYDRVAHTDPLTGLANRRTFDRVLELEIARAGRQQTPVSLAIFDIDDLTAINEAHGANVGDDVLREVASTLADCVRLVDTVARYGRDEFVLVAPGAAGHTVAQRVVDAVAALQPGSSTPPIDLRVGISVFPADGATADELLHAAERALGVAKRGDAAQIVDAADAPGQPPI